MSEYCIRDCQTAPSDPERDCIVAAVTKQSLFFILMQNSRYFLYRNMALYF